jgi:hemerythrin-like metal-binding protein
MIDDQHRKWFQLTNVFLKKAYAGQADSPVVEKALESLVAYARYHFLEEENFMRSIGYAEASLNAHIAVHDAFVERINELAARCRQGHPDTVQEMLEFLTEWLRQHIVETDVKYIRFYRRVGPKVTVLSARRLRNTARRRRLRK